MSGYERPTERGQSSKRVTFWATVWNPSQSLHGEALVSPAFGTQPELVTWVRSVRREDSQVAAWRRESTPSDFHDERLSTQDEPEPDATRLKALLIQMKADIESKERELGFAKREDAA